MFSGCDLPRLQSTDASAANHTDNPFVIAIQGPRKEVGYVLCHQPKSFDWQVRGGGKHPWGNVPAPVLQAALEKLDAICGVCGD